jgi:hypothetical protein
MVRAILAVILMVLLSACGGSSGPNSQLVRQAIALQLNQTQQELVQQLRLDQPPKFEIQRVAIAKQEPLKIQDLPAYRVQGTYDLTTKLPTRQIKQEKNPFEVYLQRQQEGKTWRLARPEIDSNESVSAWSTYLIQ